MVDMSLLKNREVYDLGVAAREADNVDFDHIEGRINMTAIKSAQIMFPEHVKTYIHLSAEEMEVLKKKHVFWKKGYVGRVWDPEYEGRISEW